jgi:peptide/nickel transport system ATP-binding protein
VRYIADRIAVMYLGRIMEWGPAERVFDGPHHPYAEALLSSAPSLDGHKARVKLEGEIPSAADPPRGCVFHTRCPRKIGPICETQVPDPWEESPGHHIRCHLGRESLPGFMSALPAGQRAIV